jgi:hypothetical protein
MAAAIRRSDFYRREEGSPSGGSNPSLSPKGSERVRGGFARFLSLSRAKLRFTLFHICDINIRIAKS